MNEIEFFMVSISDFTSDHHPSPPDRTPLPRAMEHGSTVLVEPWKEITLNQGGSLIINN